MTTNNQIKCIVCESKLFSDFKLGLKQCKHCTIVYSPAIWEGSVNDSINDDWFGESYDFRRKSIWVSIFEYINNHRTLKRIKKFKRGEDISILEIGVGSGSFLKQASKKKYTVKGCDLSYWICNYIESELNFPMHFGSLETMNDNVKFDVIVMNHVLEHVDNPNFFLLQVKRFLKKDGIVHIAVPNINCWEASISGWNSYEPYHLSYFNLKSLTLLARNTHFSILKATTHESFSGWFLSIVRFVLNVSKIQNGKIKSHNGKRFSSKNRNFVIGNLYRILMILFGILTWPIRVIQQKLGYGDELVIMLKN